MDSLRSQRQESRVHADAFSENERNCARMSDGSGAHPTRTSDRNPFARRHPERVCGAGTPETGQRVQNLQGLLGISMPFTRVMVFSVLGYLITQVTGNGKQCLLTVPVNAL